MGHKICTKESCMRRARYNLPKEKGALLCSTHRSPAMIDVSQKLCAEEDCCKMPAYNFPTETKRLFCAEHKKEGMINVKDKRCADPECSKIPSFNFPEQTKGILCATHKVEGMVDVMTKRCAHPECSKVPYFNLVVETTGLYCGRHKTPEMVNVVSKKCKEPGCKRIPNYNLPTEQNGLYCVSHKREGMVDVKNPSCKGPNCMTQAQNVRYRGYCAYCFIHLFPDEPISQQFRVKEKHYTDIIKQAFPGLTATFDRKIKGGCSKRRPDFFVDLFTFTLHVEIDEFDHSDRDTTCEVAKINDTYTDLADRPMVMLRTNPDQYRDENGVRHKSCFRPHPLTGILIADKAELKKRTDRMVEWIRHWIDRAESNEPPIDPITIDYHYTNREL